MNEELLPPQCRDVSPIMMTPAPGLQVLLSCWSTDTNLANTPSPSILILEHDSLDGKPFLGACLVKAA